jgi:hypothetical protein
MTYFANVLAGLNEAGGRFAKATTTLVVGSTPTPSVPEQPASSPWASDPVPDEPPLGYAIDGASLEGEPDDGERDISK